MIYLYQQSGIHILLEMQSEIANKTFDGKCPVCYYLLWVVSHDGILLMMIAFALFLSHELHAMLVRSN